MAVYQLTALNIFSPSQEALTNIKWKHIRHTLRMNATVHSSPIVMQVDNRLWFQHVAIVSRPIYQLAVDSVLTFTQFVLPRSFVESAYTPMILVQEVSVESAKAPHDAFALAQQVSVELIKYNPKDSIVFAQELVLQLDKTEDVQQTLNLTHGASVYKPNKYFIAG